MSEFKTDRVNLLVTISKEQAMEIKQRAQKQNKSYAEVVVEAIAATRGSNSSES